MQKPHLFTIILTKMYSSIAKFREADECKQKYRAITEHLREE
ncbi:MAG: hypothetical protein IRD7MM_02730 [Candidatus Midichloria mitochondrii]